MTRRLDERSSEMLGVAAMLVRSFALALGLDEHQRIEAERAVLHSDFGDGS
jgi:hypothetical protein